MRNLYWVERFGQLLTKTEQRALSCPEPIKERLPLETVKDISPRMRLLDAIALCEIHNQKLIAPVI